MPFSEDSRPPIFTPSKQIWQKPIKCSWRLAPPTCRRPIHIETTIGFRQSEYMRILSALAASLICAPLLAQGPIPVRVDATDAARRLFHVHMTMPAKPGPMTLMYPEWIPGAHGPTAPIINMVGLQIKAGGQTVA